MQQYSWNPAVTEFQQHKGTGEEKTLSQSLQKGLQSVPCAVGARTCGHEDETILPQQSSIDGLQLVCAETVQPKLLVKYIHHFCRMGKLHTPETLQRRVMNHWI